MSRPIGGLARTLDTLSGDVLARNHALRRNLSRSEAQEVEQQTKLALAGEAFSGWGYTDQWVGFQWPFIYAPEQRDSGSSFRYPHFSYGIEQIFVGNPVGEEPPHLGPPTAREVMDVPPPEGAVSGTTLVVIHALVVQWKRNDSNSITGAKVRLAVAAPMLEIEGQRVAYKSVAHLTFQGWAAETEEGEEA